MNPYRVYLNLPPAQSVATVPASPFSFPCAAKSSHLLLVAGVRLSVSSNPLRVLTHRTLAAGHGCGGVFIQLFWSKRVPRVA